MCAAGLAKLDGGPLVLLRVVDHTASQAESAYMRATKRPAQKGLSFLFSVVHKSVGAARVWQPGLVPRAFPPPCPRIPA